MAHKGQLGSKPIKQEQVVLALMPLKEEMVELPHKSKAGVFVRYQVQCCPKKDSRNDICHGGQLSFKMVLDIPSHTNTCWCAALTIILS
jgi:hypothetical protein